MPRETGIEETRASFKKAGMNTIREKILYTYHQAQDINEKVAHILLCMVDVIEGKKPAKTAKPGESSETEKETASLLLEITKKLEVLEDRLDFLDNQPSEEKPAPTKKKD